MRGSFKVRLTSMRDGKSRAIHNRDLFSSCIRLMQRQIFEVSGKMMRRSTVHNPIVGIIRLSCSNVGVWLWRVVAHAGAGSRCSILQLSTPPCTVTMNPTELASPLIPTSRLIMTSVATVVLLPLLMRTSTTVVVAVSLVVVAVVIVVARGVAMGDIIGSDRKNRGAFALKFCFIIQ